MTLSFSNPPPPFLVTICPLSQWQFKRLVYQSLTSFDCYRIKFISSNDEIRLPEANLPYYRWRVWRNDTKWDGSVLPRPPDAEMKSRITVVWGAGVSNWYRCIVVSLQLADHRLHDLKKREEFIQMKEYLQ